MSNTTNNYNLVKPEEGSSGWANGMNGNLDNIDTLLKNVSDLIANHQSGSGSKHAAAQISCGDSNVLAELAAKAPIVHTHPDLAPKVHTHPDLATLDALNLIQNTLDFLMPDLSQIIISANIANINGGIRIICSTSPAIYVREWNVTVEKNGNVICDIGSASNNVFISSAFLDTVTDGNVLKISVEARSGQSSKSRDFTHTFVYSNSRFDNRIIALEDIITKSLTIGNFIDSFAQDQDALQALANVLQHSNTLSQKIAELKFQ
ncbi:MAG: hypothetical protein WC965_11775 [Thiohalomonadaceae bacterium]